MIGVLLVIPILYFPLFISVILQLKYIRDFIKNDSKKTIMLLFICELISFIFYIVLYNIATNMSGWDGLIPGLAADLGIFDTIVLIIVSICIVITKICKKKSASGNNYNPVLLCFAFILTIIGIFCIILDIFYDGYLPKIPKGKTIATVESVTHESVYVSITVNGTKYKSCYDRIRVKILFY